jgi:hypothetical protein
MKCPGCQAAAGSIFWGKCELAECSIKKQLSNCAHCESFPCDRLKAFSYDETNGDNGERICNLEAWKEEGLQQWMKRNNL